MKWTPDLSVGNSTVDHQHARLFEMIDNFVNACNQRAGQEVIVNTLNFLAKYTVEHFRDEENLMAQHGYPKLNEHKLVHKEFVNYVNDTIDKAKRDGVNVSTLISVNIKLNDWLFNHIKKLDQEYGRYIATH